MISDKVLQVSNQKDRGFLYAPTIQLGKIKTSDIHKIEHMLEIMKTYEGVGLAANQVGWNKQVALAYDEESDKVRALINPEIVWHSKEQDEDVEGCLSIPMKSFVVPRWSVIEVVHGINREHLVRHGMAARIIQHELDHLDGILISDRSVGEVSMDEHSATL